MHGSLCGLVHACGGSLVLADVWLNESVGCNFNFLSTCPTLLPFALFA